MAQYFNYFNKVPYVVEESSGLDLLTNLITRIKFLDEVKNVSSSYFIFDNVYGETPESLAYKFYDSVERHWIILLFNDIIDPQYQWYKTGETFGKYIKEKYKNNPIFPNDGYRYALETVGKYYIKNSRIIYYPQEEQPKVTSELIEVDPVTYTEFLTKTDIFDENVYLYTNELGIILTDDNGIQYTVDYTYEGTTKTILEYEVEENEKLRFIKMLKKEYLAKVENEFKKLAALEL
jgi:hypothetical protein